MKKILVTGGAGYVGSILLRELIKAGYEAVCVDSLMFGGDSLIDIWDHPQFTFHKVDINDHDALDPILDGEDFFAYVHLAAIVGDPACKLHSDLARKTNWESSVHLLEKAKENGVSRFVFASTCSNYGKMADPNGMVKEDSPLAPVSLYAELKVKFEGLILDQAEQDPNFCPTSLRFATVYGLSHRMRFDLTVNEFTKDLARDKTLVIFGEQFWRPYCHVNDFSHAILAVLEADRDKVAYNVFNVGDTDENYTKQMIVDEILKKIPEGKIEYVVKQDDPRDYRVDFTKIREELGFTITKTVPQGIAEIRDIVKLGVVQDPEEQRYYNIPHEG